MQMQANEQVQAEVQKQVQVQMQIPVHMQVHHFQDWENTHFSKIMILELVVISFATIKRTPCSFNSSAGNTSASQIFCI